MSFTVYKSSAGSGKTFVLVKEYLQIVLKSPDKYKHILAITFTNKAAAEMKERILLALKELSQSPINLETKTYKFLLPELIKNTGFSEQEISERAGKALKLILHNYADFAVCTIDSFTYRIIRTFAHDLQLPMDFEIEMDSEELVEQTIDLLINNAGLDEKLTKILVDFTEQKTDLEKNWHIEQDLCDIAMLLMKEEGQMQIEKIRQMNLDDFISISKKISAIMDVFEEKLFEISGKADSLITEKNILSAAFAQGDKGISKYFQKIKNKNLKDILPNVYVRATIENNKWYSAKATSDEKNVIDSIKEKLTEYYNQIQELISSQYQQYKLFQLIRKNLYPVALLNEINHLLQQIKTENNIVHISEFNQRITDIVMNEPVPFIYERLGERFNHFLIDEFQDTSLLQWQNLLPLIENSLAENNFNMVVGDGKQAIYRWRNGEVEQFDKLPYLIQNQKNEIILEREKALINHYKEEKLHSNYRSKSEIVDFNNVFFREISSTLPIELQSIYQSLEQKFNTQNSGGFVQIDFSDKDLKKQEILQEHCVKTESIIRELLEQNFQLKDIAILCRKNDIASNIARYLIEKNIDVVSTESLLLSHSPIIKFIYALLRFLNNPTDDIAKVEIINYLIKTNKIISGGMHEDIKGAIARNDKDSAKKFLGYLSKYGFSLSIDELSDIPVFDLCEKLIRTFSLNIPANPDIEFFLDAVLKFSRKNGINTGDFIDWWEEQKDKQSIIVPEEMNAVRIMTVHKAKGLEFPAVIFPMAIDKVKRSKDSAWVSLQEKEFPELKSFLIPLQSTLQDTAFEPVQTEENNKSYLDLVNLLYVVMTRPSERMYVLSQSAEIKNETPKSLSELFIYFLKKKNSWEDAKNIYSFGIPTPHQSKNAEEEINDERFEIKNLISSAWREKVSIRHESSVYETKGNTLLSNEWGTLVHAALSKIITYNDTETVLNSMFISGEINKETQQILSEKIQSLLSNPDIRPYFEIGLQVICEQDILTHEGKIFRPDRIVLDKDKTTVIDYKTGMKDKKYEEQISIYAQLLKEIQGNPVEKKIIYIDENIIVNIPE